MFRDKVRAKIKSGKGGDGKVSYYAGKKPSGGDGGIGGNIYVEGAINIYDLSFINNDTVLKAENGFGGGINTLQGANGKDLVLKLPLITKIYNDKGDLIAKVDKISERKLLLSGGRGGIGNYFFRTKGIINLGTATQGEEEKEMQIRLVLELYSDVILIGFPNAGKSSILNSITNADSKVASYAFTTLNPRLGRLDGITIMDLPGLIEGTSEGKGLGMGFVKHTKASRYLLHLISAESENLKEEYKKIHEELTKIDMDLYTKPEIILVTKSDLISKEELTKKIDSLKELNKEILVCSIYDYDSLENLKTKIKSLNL